MEEATTTRGIGERRWRKEVAGLGEDANEEEEEGRRNRIENEMINEMK